MPTILKRCNGKKAENLNMKTPRLTMDWTEEELANQRYKWQEVASLSEQITQAAQPSDWETLLPLAEERQKKIDEFFQTPICTPLFQMITDQMAAIQNQHSVVAELVAEAIHNNDLQNSRLVNARNSLESLSQQH